MGSGESKGYCGTIHKVGSCVDFHTESETVSRNSCKDKNCPKCYTLWARRSTNHATERLMAYGEIADKMYGLDQHNLEGERVDGVNGYAHPGVTKHLVYSPPQEWGIGKLETESGIKSMRRKLYSLLEFSGVRGGSVTLHHLRSTRFADEEFKLARVRGGPYTGKGRWHWLNRSGLCSNPDYVYFSPHYHVVGKGFVMDSNEFHEKTGWIYKNIRELYTEEDIGRTLYYILSHATVVPGGEGKRGMDCVTYFGDVSKTRMGRLLEFSEYCEVKCPECGKSVRECVGWDQKFEYDEESKEDIWKLVRNDKDSRVPFNPSLGVMLYKIEKHRYYSKDNPDYYSIQTRGREPDRKKKGRPREMIVDEHGNHAYDWVSGQWFDSNGEVVD